MSPLLKKDDRLGEAENLQRWAVVRKIGDGGFAEVYEVRDTLNDDAQHALKIDKSDRRRDSRGGTVKAEAKVLRQLQACEHVCRLVPDGEGTWDGRSYLLMELLGANLAQYMRAHPHNGRMPPAEAKRIGGMLLNALEGVHRLGWLHRDVKPANFALYQGPGAAHLGDWRVIDFGIARRYVDEEAGTVLPAREGYGEFRGSTTYASIHAHLKLDLGRRDDLWSWLYVLVELLEGGLPWRARPGSPGGGGRNAATAGHSAGSAGSEESPRELAQRLKQLCLEQPARLAPSGRLPEGLLGISSHLKGLRFEDEPDYGLLRALLASIPEPAPVLAPILAPVPMPAPAQHATPQQQHTPLPVQHRPQQPQQQWRTPGANGLIRQHSGAVVAATPQPAAWMQPQQQQQLRGLQQPAAAAYTTPPYAQAPVGNGHLPRPVTLMPPGAVQQPAQMHAQPPDMTASYAGASLRPPEAAPQRMHAAAPQHQQQPGWHHAQQHMQHAQQQQQQYISAHVMPNGMPGMHEGWARAPSGELHGAAQQRAAAPADHVGMGAATRSFEEELGQIGSEFEPEDEAAHHSRAVATPHQHRQHATWAEQSGGQKRAREGEQQPDPERGALLNGYAREGKRARLQTSESADAAAAGAATLAPDKASPSGMAQMAAVVAQGRVSRAALEVKQQLRGLAPAEGIAMLAWLVDSMARNVDPAGRQHVGHWLGSLADFTDQCAARCAAPPPD